MIKHHELFKGLADPTRLRIVALLVERELCVCDLMAVLQLPQSTVSRHMIRLKSAGLVLDRRAGKWVHYRMEPSPMVDDLRLFLRQHLTGSEQFRKDIAALKRYTKTKQCAPTT
jgi:ArsR family transcriptional regulator, arsenate/arsenite/antimonite-responsive transcriptional repressor